MTILAATNIDFKIAALDEYIVWGFGEDNSIKKDIRLDSAYKSNQSFMGLWKSGKYAAVVEITQNMVYVGSDHIELIKQAIGIILAMHEDKYSSIQLCDY